MKKMGKRFMALLVVFTSIMSFLPAGFGGLVAKADDTTDATTVRVNITGENSQLATRVDSTTNQTIYSTTEIVEPTASQPDKGFDITVKNVVQDVSQLESKAKGDGTKINSATGVTYQEIQLISINGVALGDTASLNDLGISYSDIKGAGLNNENVIGKRIVGLSLGINQISYKVIYKTRTVTYTPTLDSNQKPIIGSGKYDDGTEVDHNSTSNSNMTIEQATTFVTSQIESLLYKSYVGNTSDFGVNDEIANDKNNTAPFLYTQQGAPDADMPLRYNFAVPDSTKMLKYIINFQQSLTNAEVYKNGVKDGSINVSSNSLQGSLGTIGESALIVLKIPATGGAIAKSYAIEIRYSGLDASKDFSIKDAGITKLNYNEDSSILAYVGKKFTMTTDSSGFPTYNGEITIDKKATMISLDPTLMRSKSTLAYVVTNNYVDDTGKTQVKQSVLKNGKQFIDFMASSTSNKLQVDVYEGTNGSKTGSTPLARYYFKVNLLSDNDFNMGLKFTSLGSTYLTQPGVKGNIIGSFTTDRRTYDLYTPDPVTVLLTGARSTNHEYIRVWLGDDVNSDNLKEATASSDNPLSYSDPKAQDYLERKTSLNINFGKAQKIVVQAYYDKFEYDSTGKLKTNKDGVPVYNSYSVGDKYVFYIPDNYDKTTPTNGDKSTNAALNSLKLTGYTLKDSDGNNGFSGDKFDYTATVAKEDTTAKITAVAEDDNVQSIVATINGQDGAYNLVSGEASELPLNTNGTTNIKVVVTAQDGTTSKAYTVLITNNSKSSNVNLKNVILNVGDYTFDPNADTTKVRVDQNVTNIKVTPITADSKATVTVNGEEYSANAISVSLKGAQKTEINIEVKSEDGTTSKTYTLEVYRVDVADWTNNGSSSDNDATEDDQYYDDYNKCWVDTTKYEEWGSVNGKPAYFDKKNRQVKEAWITTGGKLYYLNNLGYRASGWKVDDADGKTYYLDPTTGQMKTGWMNLNNSWYYLELNGVMHKGWLSLNKKWYYFNPNGQMVTNQSMFIDDKTYNFAQDGSIY